MIIIKHKETDKIAIIYEMRNKGRDALIKYLKLDKPFGPLRTVQLKNFTYIKEKENGIHEQIIKNCIKHQANG